MLCTSEGASILRDAIPHFKRDSGTLVQRGHSGSSTAFTKLHNPNFPSREKRCGLLSCYKPKRVEPLCQDRTLQHRGFTASSISDPAGGLDVEATSCMKLNVQKPRRRITTSHIKVTKLGSGMYFHKETIHNYH